jgi:PqqD family protein of HPr-rel-A system
MRTFRTRTIRTIRTATAILEAALSIEPFGGHVPIDHTVVPQRASVEGFASGGECVLYHPARDEATALNRTATEIWTLCDGTLTIAAIARALGERYGLDEGLFLDEVADTLLTLQARGLVGFSPGFVQS